MVAIVQMLPTVDPARANCLSTRRAFLEGTAAAVLPADLENMEQHKSAGDHDRRGRAHLTARHRIGSGSAGNVNLILLKEVSEALVPSEEGAQNPMQQLFATRDSDAFLTFAASAGPCSGRRLLKLAYVIRPRDRDLLRAALGISASGQMPQADTSISEEFLILTELF